MNSTTNYTNNACARTNLQLDVSLQERSWKCLAQSDGAKGIMLLPASRVLTTALLLPSLAPRHATTTIRCSAFFDTECRLKRTTGPAGGEVDRFVPVFSGKLLTRPAAQGTDARLEPVLLDAEAASPFLTQDGSIQAWLGTATEGPLAQYGIHDDESGKQPPGFWLLELSHLPEPPAILDGSWTPLRAAGGPGGGASAILDSDVGLSSDDEVALLSVARGLGLWHRSVPFCAVSGGPTIPVRNGRNVQSGESGTRHRPRTDPSVIMLVGAHRIGHVGLHPHTS